MKKPEIFLQELAESDKILDYTFMLSSSDDDENLKNLTIPLLESTEVKNNGRRNRIIKTAKKNAPDNALSKWISTCFKITDDKCQFTLPHYNPSKKCFFTGSYEHLPFEIAGITSLEKSKKFWYFILMQNAIMSTYDILRRFIASLNPCSTGSDFLNYLLPFHEKSDGSINRYGLHYLLTNTDSIINYETGKITLPKKKDIDHKQKTYFKSRNSRINDTADNLVEILKNTFNTNVLHADFNSNNRTELLQLNNLEFVQYLSGRKNDNNKKVSPDTIFESHYNNSIFNKNHYTKYLQQYEMLVEELQLKVLDGNSNKISATTKCKLTNADKLYCRYLLEKTLGIELSDCLYQNIQFHKSKDYLTGALPFLSECFMLPNVFSRQYIIQTALHALYVDFHPGTKAPFQNYGDFLSGRGPQVNYNSLPPEEKYDADILELVKSLNSPRKKAQDSLYSNSESTNYLDHVSDRETEFIPENYTLQDHSETAHAYKNTIFWEGSYHHMLKHLNKVIFPIYDNYFFKTLWKSLKLNCHDDTLCLVNMFLLLSKYLNNEFMQDMIFNIENVFTSLESYVAYLSKDMLIHSFPNVKFSKRADDETIDYDLYHKCIKAAVFPKNALTAPDFISLDYIAPKNSIKTNIWDYLQTALLQDR